MDYKTAGVDIEAGYKSVELMKEHVKRTMREEVLGGLIDPSLMTDIVGILLIVGCCVWQTAQKKKTA